jgi:prophage tail gpP-like protein
MTIYTKVTIAGSEITDYQTLKVNRTLNEGNAAGKFEMKVDTPFGRHANDWNVGQEAIIYADKDNTPATRIFAGVVEKITYDGRENNQTMNITGRDYSSRLQDITIQPQVFTNQEIGSIVKDIMSEVSDVTTSGVQTTTTNLTRIAFNQETVFEGIQKLAELAGYVFYVDQDKDLHFEPRNGSSTGINLTIDDIQKTKYDKTREGMANIIWVYGDRYLAGYQQVVNADGGSVFTLLYRPHNTQVFYLGNIQKGGIYGMNAEQTSGPNYLVDFFDKKLIFQSGTSIGYNSIPASGGSILVNYDRDIPIVKTGRNNTSIALYGPKTEVTVDKSIKDPSTALALVKKKLEKSDLFNRMEIEVDGWYSGLSPGKTVGVTLSDFGISESQIGVLGINYSFDKNSIQSEKIMNVQLDKKVLDITDKISDMDKRLRALEAPDMGESDVLPRLELSAGSFTIVGSYWEIRTRDLGSSFILSNPTSGKLGSVNPQPYLGDSRGIFNISRSGGYY